MPRFAGIYTVRQHESRRPSPTAGGADTGEHKTIKTQRGQTKTSSGWVSNERDDANLFKQPAMTGFRIPPELVNYLDGMVNMSGKPVIRHNERSH